MDDINFLMSNEDAESDVDALDSIKFRNNQYDVHGIKNEDGISYKTIIIEKVLNNDVGDCDIVLHLNENNGQILQENDDILANFKFTIDDNCNFEFVGIQKLRKRFKFEFNDKFDADDIEQTISKYCLNHSKYLTRIVDENTESNGNVYSLNERMKPPFDDKVATLFEQELQEKYAGSFIKFMEHYVPLLILDEINNAIKLTLGAITVIIGKHSFFFETLGDAGIGKTALMETVIEHCIPDGYIIILNKITESAFFRYGEYNPRYYERLILYFGDLGDDDKMKQLKLVFDDVKILITDKIVIYEKSQQNNQNQYDRNITITLIADSIGCLYGSVPIKEIKESDIKGQKQSRILPITPSIHGNIELARFIDQSKTYGTKGFDDYNDAAEKMVQWQEFLKKKIANFDKEKIVFVNPFRHMFNNSFKLSPTWIRDYNRFKALLETLSYINLERSIKIQKNGKTFVIPCLEDVQDFLKITSDNMGLRVNEKNLLLKLKKEFAFDFDKIADNVIMANDYNPTSRENNGKPIDEQYQSIVDGCIIHAIRHGNFHKDDDATLDDWQGMNDKSVLLSPEIVDNLYFLYGLSDKNRQRQRNDEDALPILFFTASQIKRIFKSHNAIKSVSNINETLNSFVEKGFLQKLPYKTASRNENVFYVEPLILDVHEQYEITETDKIEAIAVIMNDMQLFDEKDIRKVCKDYKVAFIDVQRYIEDNSEI